MSKINKKIIMHGFVYAPDGYKDVYTWPEEAPRVCPDVGSCMRIMPQYLQEAEMKHKDRIVMEISKEEEYNNPFKEAFINRACEYLKNNKNNVETEDNGIAAWIPDGFIEDFKKYLNEEL